MTATTYDPVSRVRMSFEPEGENLIVDLWLGPPAGCPPTCTQGKRSTGRWSRAAPASATATPSG